MMQQLVEALDADWKGCETLRDEILRDGKFYGNNDDFSEKMAQAFHASVFRFAEGLELTSGASRSPSAISPATTRTSPPSAR